jgi:hypothetical protein
MTYTPGDEALRGAGTTASPVQPGGFAESPTQNAVQTLAQQDALQTGMGQFQYNLGQYQIGQLPSQLQQTLAYNNAMAQNQLGALGISAQQNTLQGQGLAEQGAQAATQQGIEQQQYALTAGQYPEQQAEAALNYQNALRGNAASQAASGTATTQGGLAATGTLGAQYGFQQEDIARAQAQAGLGQQSEVSGYGYSQQQLQNAQKNLGLVAKQNGMNQQQVYQMLSYGNAQATQGAQQNLIQLLSGEAQTGAANVGQLQSQLSNIGFLSGLNTQAGGPVPPNG